MAGERPSRSFGIGAVAASCGETREGSGGVSSSVGKMPVLVAGSVTPSGCGQDGAVGHSGLTNSEVVRAAGAGAAGRGPSRRILIAAGGGRHGRRPSTSRSGATPSAPYTSATGWDSRGPAVPSADSSDWRKRSAAFWISSTAVSLATSSTQASSASVSPMTTDSTSTSRWCGRSSRRTRSTRAVAGSTRGSMTGGA
ncbi:hypothetical protein [Nonomuraea recticatena]|uniref:hypothetical protein n=1 Tax=Nonomuraea recticatena TaxID=46178 RepID=UPI00360A1286